MPIHDWTRVFAGIFHDFHVSWIAEVKRALNAGLLPEGYYALAEQIAGGFGPDVLTLQSGLPAPSAPRGNGTTSAETSSGGIALAVSPPRVQFTAEGEPELYARKRNRVVIRHGSEHTIVAVIEIVSPGNKASRHALPSFVNKAVELLDQGIHLLVIDLFPPTPRDPQGIHEAIWGELVEEGFTPPPDKPLTLASYAAGNLFRAFVQPVAVGDMLPDMPLFLTPEVYVNVPLERTYCTAFDSVPRFWREVLERPSETP
jgi:Protein of unknown function (DUF4058)